MKKILIATAMLAATAAPSFASDSHDSGYCNPVEGTLAVGTASTGAVIGTGIGFLGGALELVTLGHVDTGFEKAPKAGYEAGRDFVNPDCLN